MATRRRSSPGGAYRQGVTIRFTNLAEFRKALRRVEEQLPNELTREMRAIAKETTADVRKLMRADFTNPRRRGDRMRATSALFYRANTKGASIGYHSKNPYVGWLDFGGTLRATAAVAPKRRGRPNTQTRLPFRTSRYLYPAIIARREANTRRLEKAVVDLTNKAMQGV